SRHQAKVYGQASFGAPAMSVPHLDTRVVDGDDYLLFGPYAGFSPKFLKDGRFTDLPFSVRGNNLATMLNVAKDNTDLVTYLVSELAASKKSRYDSLYEFIPHVDPADWEFIQAGQRVQVMKKDPKSGGVLAFGTELVSSADGSFATLLGASPGASTAVSIVTNLLKTCFPRQYGNWESSLKDMIPSLDRSLADDETLLPELSEYTARTLQLVRADSSEPSSHEPARICRERPTARSRCHATCAGTASERSFVSADFSGLGSELDLTVDVLVEQVAEPAGSPGVAGLRAEGAHRDEIAFLHLDPVAAEPVDGLAPAHIEPVLHLVRLRARDDRSGCEGDDVDVHVIGQIVRIERPGGPPARVRARHRGGLDLGFIAELRLGDQTGHRLVALAHPMEAGRLGAGGLRTPGRARGQE